MSKSNKTSPIKGISQVPSNKLTVLKSNPLTSLWRSELTLSEFKILDTYLARIDSHKPEQRQVQISKEEIENVFGISKINIKELDARLNHLVGQAVRISDGDYKHGFAWVSLFEEARVDIDQNGVQTVYLECTQKAMKYFFNCENIGYLRYKLQSVKDIKSRYTYVMFLYIEKNRYRTDWIVPLDDLKLFLNCEKDDLYKDFKFFNQRILKRCKKEIQQKTECNYEYETIKKGRKVVAIHFNVYPLISIGISNQHIGNNQYSAKTDLLLNDAVQNEFSDEEIQELQSLIVTVPEIKFPSVDDTDNIDIRRYHYLDQKYKAMNVYDKRSKIKNRFAYLKKMITIDTERIGD